MRTIEKRGSMTPADRRNILMAAGAGMLAGGLGTMLYGLGSHQASVSRFARRVDGIPESEMRTPGELVSEGTLPADSVLLSDGRAIADRLSRNADEIVSSPLARLLQKAMIPHMVRSVVSGRNAFYGGRDADGRPVFAVSNGRIARRMALHEAGHARAHAARPGYMREYYDAGSSYLLRPDRLRDSKGWLTRYGLESEAWDLAGVPENDPLRRDALGTYRTATRYSALHRLALALALGGSGLLAYAAKAYPATRQGGVKTGTINKSTSNNSTNKE